MKKDLFGFSDFDDNTVENISEKFPDMDKSEQNAICGKVRKKLDATDDFVVGDSVSGVEFAKRPIMRYVFGAAAAVAVLAVTPVAFKALKNAPEIPENVEQSQIIVDYVTAPTDGDEKSTTKIGETGTVTTTDITMEPTEESTNPSTSAVNGESGSSSAEKMTTRTTAKSGATTAKSGSTTAKSGSTTTKSGSTTTKPATVAMEQYRIRITMTTDEARDSYEMGEKLSFAGFYVTGYHYAYDENRNLIDETRFDNESLQKLVDNGTVTVDVGDFYTAQCAGSHTITITYGTATTEIHVWVQNNKESHAMIIESLPTKTEYLLGEELDLTGAKISGYFSDGKNRYDWENADLQELVDEGVVTLNDMDFYDTAQKSGKRSVYFSYYNAFGCFQVDVIDPNEENTLNLLTLPDKLTYKIGEKLDLTGASFSAFSRSTGSVDKIPEGEVSEYIDNGTLKLDASEFDYTKPGTYTIYLTYGDDTYFPDTQSFEVTVTDEKVEGEFIYVSNPDQTVYSSYDELDFTGAYLTVAENGDFDNAEEYFLTDLIAEGLVTVDASEYNSEHGLHKIYFTYEGKTDSITVTVAPIDVPDVHDIVSVNTQNMKTEYRVGEELDLTGALFGASKYRYGIVGHFDQCNLLEYVEKGMLEVEATDFDNETPGTYTIYVTYGLDTTSFDVTVKGKKQLPQATQTVTVTSQLPMWYASDSVKKIVIENGITTIGNETFYGCEALTSVTMPDSVTTLGSFSFSYCTNLTSVKLSNNLERIESATFFFLDKSPFCSHLFGKV